jgi:hypothetical protein
VFTPENTIGRASGSLNSAFIGTPGLFMVVTKGIIVGYKILPNKLSQAVNCPEIFALQNPPLNNIQIYA